MASPKKKQELTTLYRELATRSLTFYATRFCTRDRSGPDIILPLVRVAIWMQRADPSDCGFFSRGQTLQHAALRAAGWKVLLPHGCQDALEQIEDLV